MYYILIYEDEPVPNVRCLPSVDIGGIVLTSMANSLDVLPSRPLLQNEVCHDQKYHSQEPPEGTCQTGSPYRSAGAQTTKRHQGRSPGDRTDHLDAATLALPEAQSHGPLALEVTSGEV